MQLSFEVDYTPPITMPCCCRDSWGEPQMYEKWEVDDMVKEVQEELQEQLNEARKSVRV